MTQEKQEREETREMEHDDHREGCDYCDSPGGLKTYRNQVSMPIDGRVRDIDHCIHRIVAALNASNIPTVMGCCGHGKMKVCIVLEDGRVLIIQPLPE